MDKEPTSKNNDKDIGLELICWLQGDEFGTELLDSMWDKKKFSRLIRNSLMIALIYPTNKNRILMCLGACWLHIKQKMHEDEKENDDKIQDRDLVKQS